VDDRLRNGTWKRRSEAASVPPASLPTREGLLHAPIGSEYAGETTEWTPLTRRAAAARAYTPVPVSRRTGLIAGGVVLAGSGLGVIGVSALALTVGLVAGAVIAADRLAVPGPTPVAHHAPIQVEEGAPVRVQPEVAVAAAPAEPAAAPAVAPAPPAKTRRTARPTRTARTSSRGTAPRPPAAAPVAAPAPVAAAPTPTRTPTPYAAPAAPEASAPVAAAPLPAAAPAPVAAEAPPAPEAPTVAPAQDDSWFAQAAQVATDLLADEPEAAPVEDSLDDLVADLGRDPAPTDVEDSLDDLIADLSDEPLPTAPAPVTSAAPVVEAAPVAVAAAAVASEDDGLADLLADLDDEALPTAAAPIEAAAAPAEDGGWMASASSLVGAVVDQVSGDGVATADMPGVAAMATSSFAPAAPVAAPSAPVAAAAPAAPVAGYAPAAPVAAPSAPAGASVPAAAPVAPVAPAAAPVEAPRGFEPASAAAYAPPPPPACVGELCGDDAALGYVDGSGHDDLLAGGGDDWAIDVQETNVAAQFADMGGDDEGDLDGLDTLDSMMVEVRTDQPGVSVEIDGAYAGVTPLLVGVGSGYHAVKLTLGDVSQRFELQPKADPDAWCFDMKGRTFKIDRCR